MLELQKEDRPEDFDRTLRDFSYNNAPLLKNYFILKTEKKNDKFIFSIELDKTNFNTDKFIDVQSFRIDIYLKNTKFKAQKGLDLLKWNDKQFKDPEVKGLYESIMFALNELRPEDKNIYTFYFIFE